MPVKTIDKKRKKDSTAHAFEADVALQQIAMLNDESESRYAGRMILSNQLSRSLVSFQANKRRAVIAGSNTRKRFRRTSLNTCWKSFRQ